MSMDQLLLDELNDACTSALGFDVTVDGVAIEAVFADDYNGLGDLGVGIGTSSPYLMGKSSELAGAEEGIEVIVNSVIYTVAGPPEPDGMGMTTLRLEIV